MEGSPARPATEAGFEGDTADGDGDVEEDDGDGDGDDDGDGDVDGEEEEDDGGVMDVDFWVVLPVLLCVLSGDGETAIGAACVILWVVLATPVVLGVIELVLFTMEEVGLGAGVFVFMPALPDAVAGFEGTMLVFAMSLVPVAATPAVGDAIGRVYAETLGPTEFALALAVVAGTDIALLPEVVLVVILGPVVGVLVGTGLYTTVSYLSGFRKNTTSPVFSLISVSNGFGTFALCPFTVVCPPGLLGVCPD